MMDDLISRKSAIEIVKGIDRHFAKYIEELPSAEPCGDAVSRNGIVQKLNKMDRYVSTELRLCDTDKKFPQNEVFIVDDVYEEIVGQLPSIQPDIIYCKDCRHRWTYKCMDGMPLEGCDLNQTFYDANIDYCSLAERRE